MDIEANILPRRRRNKGWKLLGKYKRHVLAILFLGLEAISLVLDLLGKSELVFVLAAFLLSVLGFGMTMYTCINERTIALTRSQAERKLGVVEIAFSAVQLVATFIHFVLASAGVKENYNTVSLFPIVFSIIVVIFIFRKDRVGDSSDDDSSILLATGDDSSEPAASNLFVIVYDDSSEPASSNLLLTVDDDSSKPVSDYDSSDDDSSNLLTTPQGGESTMDSSHWINQFKPDVRERIFNKIIYACKKNAYHSVQEGLDEFKRVGVIFGEKVFSADFIMHDYWWRTIAKMLTVELTHQDGLRDTWRRLQQRHLDAEILDSGDKFKKFK